MVSEEFEKDEIKEFDNLGEALEYIKPSSSIKIEPLNTCKGQKLFNPSHES